MLFSITSANFRLVGHSEVTKRIDLARTSCTRDSKVIWCSRELPHSAIKSNHSYHRNLRTYGSFRLGPSVTHK